MKIKCEGCGYECKRDKIEIMDEMCPKCNEWNSLVAFAELCVLTGDIEKNSEKLKKELNKWK